ncbi:MAG: hypothetical protein J6S40_01660 [Thermoguttaceae bacterium]|nr:hypothetical protein [Thermoguttaceae bacterium]
MSFLFHKGLALAGCRDNPQQRRKLFEHFGGGDDLRRLCDKMDAAADMPQLNAADPFDTSFPDPNLIAGYFDEPSAQSDYQRRYEEACQDSKLLLNEAASTAQILHLFQEEPTSAPKSCRQRAYQVGEPVKEKPAPPRRKPGMLSSFFRPRRGSEGKSESSYDELSRFETSRSAPSAARPKETPRPIELHAPVIISAEKKPEVETVEPDEKKRGIFLPFVCAAIAAALLFHFYPVIHPTPTRRTPQSFETDFAPAENGFVPSETELLPTAVESGAEPAADGLSEFEEAPVYDKIATPPQADFELIDSYQPAGGTFAWRDLSLLSDPEKAELNGVRPALRPLRRGMKTDVVTAIPEGK